MLSLWIGALDQGLAYAGLALGVDLTLRVLNFADITVDGSFALGGGSVALGKLVRWGRGPVGGILSSGGQGTKLTAQHMKHNGGT